jgi:uncharacterized protein
MLINQKQNETKGSFYVEENGVVLAEMTYSIAGAGLLIIDHTEVSDSLRGKNVGYQLVNHAVEFARLQNKKILPLCPFARSVFEKKANEFADVLR